MLATRLARTDYSNESFNVVSRERLFRRLGPCFEFLALNWQDPSSDRVRIAEMRVHIPKAGYHQFTLAGDVFGQSQWIEALRGSDPQKRMPVDDDCCIRLTFATTLVDCGCVREGVGCRLIDSAPYRRKQSALKQRDVRVGIIHPQEPCRRKGWQAPAPTLDESVAWC